MKRGKPCDAEVGLQQNLIYMKSILGLFLLLGSTGVVLAQNKEKQDVTYSTHNYKHPNKSTKAATWEHHAGNSTFAPLRGEESANQFVNSPNNYKAKNRTRFQNEAQLVTTKPNGFATILNPSEAPGNYKHRASVRKIDTSNIAKAKSNKPPVAPEVNGN